MANHGPSKGRIVDLDAGYAGYAGLLAIVESMKPMTVRQLYYQATVAGLYHKTELGYGRVQKDCAKMRSHGDMPLDWIEDNTRSEHRLLTFDSPAEALLHRTRNYRKSFWTDSDVRVQIWLEKDALSSTIAPVTEQYDVPLMVACGYPSISFLHSAAEQLKWDSTKPAYIYHLGDFDPSGVDAGRSIDEGLQRLAPEVEINFERLAVTPKQIKQWKLPTRPTKKTDSRAAAFGSDISVELDAIAPTQLRALVLAAIERHMPKPEFDKLKKAEARERKLINKLVEQMRA